MFYEKNSFILKFGESNFNIKRLFSFVLTTAQERKMNQTIIACECGTTQNKYNDKEAFHTE